MESRVHVTRENVVLTAMRFACLSYHCPWSPDDVVEAVVKCFSNKDVESGDYFAMADLVEKVVQKHTDPEWLAVDRIKSAIQNLTGPRRIAAAYIANGGVLTPVDVERIAKEPTP